MIGEKINNFLHYREMKKECYSIIGEAFGLVPTCTKYMVKNILRDLKKGEESTVKKYANLKGYIKFRKGYEAKFPKLEEELKENFPFIIEDENLLKELKNIQINVCI